MTKLFQSSSACHISSLTAKWSKVIEYDGSFMALLLKWGATDKLGSH